MSGSQARYRVGVDIGGTFTDVALAGGGSTFTSKVLTTPSAPEEGVLEGLGQASFTELTDEKGVSEAKACQLMAALELGRRAVSLAREDKPLINHPRDIYNLLGAEMSGLDQEHIKVVLLNTRNEVMSVHDVYKGNVHTAIIRVAEVIRPAIRENAPAMVAVHNHPTGDPEPSAQDVSMTVDVRQAGELLDIELVDHVIIGKGGRFSSLKEHNLGFH